MRSPRTPVSHAFAWIRIPIVLGQVLRICISLRLLGADTLSWASLSSIVLED